MCTWPGVTAEDKPFFWGCWAEGCREVPQPEAEPKALSCAADVRFEEAGSEA